MKSWLLGLLLVLIAVVSTGCTTANVSLSSSSNPSVVGQSITLTATVTPTTYRGEVSFFDGDPDAGGRLLGRSSTQTSPGTGTYRIDVADLTVGDHDLFARTADVDGTGDPCETPFPGCEDAPPDGGFVGATSAPLSQRVNLGGVSLSVSSSQNPATVGDSITFSAAVKSTGGPPVGGTVTFTRTLDGQTTTLGQAPVVGGTATLAPATLPTGNHVISATFNGDGTYPAGAKGSLTQRVNGATATVTVTSSANPSIVGKTVNYTARVSVTGNVALQGTLRFELSGQGTRVLPLSGNQATVSVTPTQAGGQYVFVTYQDDPNVNEAYGSLTQIISKANSVMTLSQSSSQSDPGTRVTFTAVVATTNAPNVKPSGNVVFSKGTNELGFAPLNANGVAAFSISTLGSGSHTITARYAGDTNVNASEGSIRHFVKTNPSTVTVTSSPRPSKLGAEVRIEAVVKSGLTTPSGNVTFTTQSGALGVVPLGVGGRAVFLTKNLPLGPSTITASFTGSDFFPSGSGSVVHVVDRGDTAIALTSTPNPSRAGESVTFLASLTSAAAGLGGEIEIFDNGASIGTFAVDKDAGSYVTDRLPVGTHEIVVKYKGNQRFSGSDSATLVQTVVAAEEGSAPDPNGGGANNGNDGNLTVQVGGTGGDDDGCHVGRTSSTSNRGTFALIALALFAATRRRRVLA